MDQDDPEKRIAELERQIAEAKAAAPAQGNPAPVQSQWPTPGMPPPPAPLQTGPPFGWQGPQNFGALSGPGFPGPGSGRGFRVGRFLMIIVPLVVILAVGCIVLAVVANFKNSSTARTQSSPTGPAQSTTTTTESSSTASGVLSVPQGGNLTVNDDTTKVVACNDGNLTVEDISVTVTGHCAKLTVSASSDQVTADSADSIDVGGIQTTLIVSGHCGLLTISGGSDNHVTVGSADTINADGIDNVVIFRSGSPQITNSGIDNTVKQG
jgi:hypothetical protein